jgi:hypothetical protein
MDANLRDPKPHFATKIFALFNLIAAFVWAAIGLIASAMGALSVHGEDMLIPMILVVAGALSCASGVLLFVAAADGRPRRSAVVTISLAVACGLLYWTGFALKGEYTRTPDTVQYVVFHFPALLAVFALAEVIYLWWARLAPRTT